MLRNAASLSGLGIQMGATIYLGNLLGSWIDAKYNFAFVETLLTLLSIFAAMYIAIRKVINLK